MKGSVLMSGILLVAAAAGIGLWYTTERAYYHEVDNVSRVMAYGDSFPVTEYQGIDGDTSPLKMRACFTVDWDYFPTDEFIDVATPLTAPRWFKCFNARQIGEDLQAKRATAILSDENQPYGFDTYIAQYPEGQAYMWRQINPCGDALFGGGELPADCPAPPKEGAMEKTPELASGGIGPIDVEIKLTPIGGTPETIAIGEPQATVDNALVDSFWACFHVDLSYAMITETYEIFDAVAPTMPVSSLPCFDAQQIIDDVQSGAAIAVLGQQFTLSGMDQIVAIYQDGRAFAWNQKAE